MDRGKWRRAREATWHRSLGDPDTTGFVEERIRELRQLHGDQTVLLGGPPCQAYSLVGRARMGRALERDPEGKMTLYREYVKALRLLRPAAFVMENVKGILSARQQGKRIFPAILKELEGNPDNPAASYRLFALTSDADHPANGFRRGLDFVVQAEDYGVPQARHRVFVVGLRGDLADRLPKKSRPRLTRHSHSVPVRDVLGNMPPLRSGLSRNDSLDNWRQAILDACDMARMNGAHLFDGQPRRFRQAVSWARRQAESSKLGRRAPGGTRPPSKCPDDLSDWLADPRLEQLPNNETRGHMASDLARYLFAAAFAKATRLSRRPFAETKSNRTSTSTTTESR